MQQRARVVAFRDGAIGLAPVNTAGCEQCASGKGCGSQLFRRGDATTTLWVPTSVALPFEVGDEVMLSVSKGLLQRASLVMFGLPIVLVLILVTVLSQLGVSEPVQALLVVGILLAGALFLRRRGNTFPNQSIRISGFAAGPCAKSTASPSRNTSLPPTA